MVLEKRLVRISAGTWTLVTKVLSNLLSLSHKMSLQHLETSHDRLFSHPFKISFIKHLSPSVVFLCIYIFISNQNLQLYKLICWRKSCDAL
jgi:hypothetical protein